MSKFYLILVMGALSQNGFSWGERGHDVVARVAARLVAHKSSNNESIVKPFLAREHMLAHLSNVPDIVWRSDDRPQKVRDLNGPTHYIGIDLLVGTSDNRLDSIPAKVEQAADLAKKRKQKLFTEIGTAPWRAGQLFSLMVEAFSEATNAKKNKQMRINHANEALLMGGLLAHFIGDLAQPLHTTSDFDGWEKGQGGLHKFYESNVVSELSLNLANDVYAFAVMRRPYETLLKKPQDSTESKAAMSDRGTEAALALAMNSYHHIETLLAIDKEASFLKRSRQIGIGRVEAERKKAAKVAEHYKDFTVQRLALAADTLAHLWYQAWLLGGQPDLSEYESYYYPVSPKFVPVTYLPKASGT